MHTLKYHSVLKRKDILINFTTWLNLEDIMLNEISQSRKDKYCRYLHEVPRVVKFRDRKYNEWWLLGAGEAGNRELLFNWHRVIVLQDVKCSGDEWG